MPPGMMTMHPQDQGPAQEAVWGEVPEYGWNPDGREERTSSHPQQVRFDGGPADPFQSGRRSRTPANPTSAAEVESPALRQQERELVLSSQQQQQRHSQWTLSRAEETFLQRFLRVKSRRERELRRSQSSWWSLLGFGALLLLLHTIWGAVHGNMKSTYALSYDDAYRDEDEYYR